MDGTSLSLGAVGLLALAASGRGSGARRKVLAAQPVETLDALAAARRGPVRLGDPSPWRFRWKPMSAAWRERFDAHHAVPPTAIPAEQEARQALVDGLLAWGGDRVLVPLHEPDLGALRTRGQLWTGKGHVRCPGEASRCHGNAAALWEANPDLVLLATGYALSDDGLWRQHSFAVQARPRRIVETTVPRVAYFGFVLTTKESGRFAEENLW